VKLAILIAAAESMFAQTYRGTLEPELFVPGGLLERVELKRSACLAEWQVGDLPYCEAGKVRDARAVFVEPATLCVDVDGDGRFSGDEKYDLGRGAVEIRFPLPGSVFKTYPVRVALDSQGILGASTRAFVRGHVTINGVEVNAGFAFDWKTGSVTPNHGWQGFDGEYSFVDEPRVYHAGSAYIRIRSVDLALLEFVLEAAHAAEYTGIELKPGEEFPDFSFTELNGAVHRLADYGPTLLDFWATWCAPCIADLPRLREIAARGVHIIGMNVDQDQEKVRAMNLPWPQTKFSSIRDLVERRARIQTYPTYVLLDRDHRIVALGEDALNPALYCDRCDPSSSSHPGH
jgi:thiol-disulfide isomerase/thioredoxin